MQTISEIGLPGPYDCGYYEGTVLAFVLSGQLTKFSIVFQEGLMHLCAPMFRGSGGLISDARNFQYH